MFELAAIVLTTASSVADVVEQGVSAKRSAVLHAALGLGSAPVPDWVVIAEWPDGMKFVRFTSRVGLAAVPFMDKSDVEPLMRSSDQGFLCVGGIVDAEGVVVLVFELRDVFGKTYKDLNRVFAPHESPILPRAVADKVLWLLFPYLRFKWRSVGSHQLRFLRLPKPFFPETTLPVLSRDTKQRAERLDKAIQAYIDRSNTETRREIFRHARFFSRGVLQKLDRRPQIFHQGGNERQPQFVSTSNTAPSTPVRSGSLKLTFVLPLGVSDRAKVRWVADSPNGHGDVPFDEGPIAAFLQGDILGELPRIAELIRERAERPAVLHFDERARRALGLTPALYLPTQEFLEQAQRS